jgi:F-type H+-transporting ATPase subunit a
MLLLAAQEATESKIVETMSEMNNQVIISIPKIGPFDMSVTNTVLYMWLAAVVVFVFFFVAAKRSKKDPEGLQTTAEILLNFATGHLTGQIGEKGKKYYYLILTLFAYIFVSHLIGLVPKPGYLRPTTPTANINVTFGLAMVVFFVTQYQGFHRHGARKYVGSWLSPPGVPRAMRPALSAIFFITHFMGEFFKPLSLAVRLFGNVLAGHLIILVMLGLILQYGAGLVVPASLFIVIMLLFEVFVAFIQAYIFSLLSVVYIESAIYAGH